MTITFNWRQMFKTLGILLITESFFMLVAAGVAAIYGEYDLKYLLIVAAATLVCGGSAFLLNKNADRNVGIREGYTIVGLVDYFLFECYRSGSAVQSFVSNAFETMSGFTTTGVILTILKRYRTVCFWRSLMRDWRYGNSGVVVSGFTVFAGRHATFIAEVPAQLTTNCSRA